MSYADDLVKLRKRMLDALTVGVVDNNSKDLFEATLIQILNESERQRQTCVSRSEDLRRQASIADGQASAYTQVGSIVYNVLNGYIMAAEKQKREELDQAAERAEKENAKQSALLVEIEDDDIKKKRKKV